MHAVFASRVALDLARHCSSTWWRTTASVRMRSRSTRISNWHWKADWRKVCWCRQPEQERQEASSLARKVLELRQPLRRNQRLSRNPRQLLQKLPPPRKPWSQRKFRWVQLRPRSQAWQRSLQRRWLPGQRWLQRRQLQLSWKLLRQRLLNQGLPRQQQGKQRRLWGESELCLHWHNVGTVVVNLQCHFDIYLTSSQLVIVFFSVDWCVCRICVAVG